MKRRPSRVRIAGREWLLKFLPSSKMDGNMGLAHFDTGMLAIQARMGAFSTRDTVLHETLHAILHTQGHAYGLEVEEHYVNSIATGLTGVLQDNPEFAQWLIHPIPPSP